MIFLLQIFWIHVATKHGKRNFGKISSFSELQLDNSFVAILGGRFSCIPLNFIFAAFSLLARLLAEK